MRVVRFVQIVIEPVDDVADQFRAYMRAEFLQNVKAAKTKVQTAMADARRAIEYSAAGTCGRARVCVNACVRVSLRFWCAAAKLKSLSPPPKELPAPIACAMAMDF